jgi:two-component system, cell cycle sensor histidine kinase and response regulator CckA
METILVVDDEPTVLNLCRRILELGGYSVVTAPSGPDALRRLTTGAAPVDLALLDVMMPVMNGIELARRIQAEKPNTPVVLMTGFGPQEIARVAGDSNPYRIIWKPFKTESLLRMIENALAGSTGAGKAPDSK